MPLPLNDSTDPALEHLIAQMQHAMAQFVNGDATAAPCRRRKEGTPTGRHGQRETTSTRASRVAN